MSRKKERCGECPGTAPPHPLLSPEDKITIRAFAQGDMNIRLAAEAAYMSYTGFVYRLRQIRSRTGLNPRNFYDLMKLLELTEEE